MRLSLARRFFAQRVCAILPGAPIGTATPLALRGRGRQVFFVSFFSHPVTGLHDDALTLR